MDIHDIMIRSVGARADHGGEAGLELAAVKEPVAVSIEASKDLLDGCRQLCRHPDSGAVQHRQDSSQMLVQNSKGSCLRNTKQNLVPQSHPSDPVPP